jgi:(2Fe-2S) ferredoxin
VAGSGPDGDCLKEVPNITMKGFLTGEELTSLMADARVMLLPSVWYENCPLSILENHSYGVPVITVDSGGMAELVEDGKTGTLIREPTPEAVAEAIRRCFEDEAYYSTLKENGMGDTALELAEYLLKNGANPYLRIDKEPDYPGFSAYDLIKGNSDLLQALQQKGFTFTSPAMEIRSGEYLAADVCRAALTHPDTEAITPHFDTIATLLNPTDELREQEIYTDALRNAVILMAKVDAGKTSHIIANMPLWNDPQAMKSQDHITTELLYALQDTRSVVLPKELLLKAAEECQKNGAYESAAILTELLGRADDSDALIEQLSNDARPAIKAGALSARLYKEGLPAASDGGVEAWLAEHKRTADTPVLQKAVLLTSIERLWYGDMSTEEMDSFVVAVQELGLSRVAEIYQQIITHLSHPEQLDEIMATQHLWAYELEIATAQFLLQHKDEILAAPAEDAAQ